MIKKQRHIESMDEDEKLSSCTYASRYMTEPVPKYELPERSVSERTAYRLIRDELYLDGRPVQNLASFCSTWMEPEGDELIQQGLHYNLADEDEYPHVIKILERCVNILANLFHAPSNHSGGAVGTATIGSSEAIMLAGLAMKWNWRKRRNERGEPTDRPNIVLGNNVQVCWKKFARYFDVECKYIPLEVGRYVITPELVADAVDENTIGVCAVLGSTFTGEFEPVEEINDTLAEVNKARGFDIPVHVDAASGGFVAPFLYPDLEWDFRLPLVRSINVSGHKYGLCYPGIGWAIWRDRSWLPEELVFRVNYLGGEMETFNLNFSRPASGVLGQYYNFLRLGREGYANVMKALKRNADYIRERLVDTDQFDVLSDDRSLPLVALSVRPELPYTAFDLSHKLREKGWIVPAYTMPGNAESITCLRAVVREKMSREVADDLVEDILAATSELNRLKPGKKTTSVSSGSSDLIC